MEAMVAARVEDGLLAKSTTQALFLAKVQELQSQLETKRQEKMDLGKKWKL